MAEGVTKQRVLQPNRKAMDVATAVDISQGQRPEGALMPTAAVQVAPELAERAAQQFQQQGQQQQLGQEQQQQAEVQEAVKEEGGQQEQQPPQAQQQGQRAQQQEPYLVPACAAWFRWDGIADVEEAHFKDFLAAHPANPERYRDYRNAVINKYRFVRQWGQMQGQGQVQDSAGSREVLPKPAGLPAWPRPRATLPLHFPFSPPLTCLPACLSVPLILHCLAAGRTRRGS